MAGTPGFGKSEWETVLDGDKTFTVSGLFQIPTNLLQYGKGDSLKARCLNSAASNERPCCAPPWSGGSKSLARDDPACQGRSRNSRQDKSVAARHILPQGSDSRIH